MKPRKARLVGIALAAGLSLLALGSADDFTLPYAGLVWKSNDPAHELLVYQNGFCQVLQRVKLAVAHGRAELELPNGAFLDTLRILGIDVLEIESREGDGPLSPGDLVVVTTTRGVLQGTVMETSPRLIVLTQNGTQILEYSHVVSIHIVQAGSPEPGRVRVALKVDGPDGVYDVTLSYLLRGIGWHAAHRIDVDASRLQTWITVTGSPGFAVERLTIVSGAPRFVMETGGHDYHVLNSDAGLMGADAAGRWSAAALDEYHEYTLDRPIDLPAGREMRLRLFEDRIELSHEYVAHAGLWSGSLVVQHEWTFVNTVSQPLPSGIVSFYRSGRFIGQDSMNYVARDEFVTLVSGEARDLLAAAASRSGCPDQADKQTITLSVTNRKEEATTVRVVLDLPDGSRLESTNPRPQAESRGQAEWRFVLEPGETQSAEATARLFQRC